MANIKKAIENLELDLTWDRQRPYHTIYQYKRLAERFLSQVSSIPPSDNDVKRFIARFQSPSQRRFVYYVLKRLFNANLSEGWVWTLNRPPESGPVIAATLTQEEVAQLIHASRYMEDHERAYLALSTTYGFRRTEMALMSRDNIQDGHIVVQTLKRGLLRRHIIPEEVEPIIAGYNFRKIDPWHLSMLFHKIWKKAGLPRKYSKVGWHAVRSSLITYLIISKCPGRIITRFIGWRTLGEVFRVAGESPQLSVYFRPPEEEEIDQVVFEHHPFLNYWREV